MRVLDTFTGEFVDIDPRDSSTKYAILSHTWDSEGEQTHQQLREIQKRCPHSHNHDPLSYLHVLTQHPPALNNSPIWNDAELSPKIREACRVAYENGYRYLWIDSCCIDKTNSSELSESLNSMYQWYALADVCYAFLADVPAEEDPKAEDSHFRVSRWFTRGWTLQELIAPRDLVFLAEDWTAIGSKLSLGDLITEVTNIDYNALLHLEPLDEFSVAQRLSWAAKRQTIRVEDRAYSLLGIFDINMPTLYGEGERAFRRLQEEIMRHTPDQSLFAWTTTGLPDPSSGLHDPETARGAKPRLLRQVRFQQNEQQISLLAPSPDVFSECRGIESLTHDEVIRRLRLTANRLPMTAYDFTPYGIRIQLPVIRFSSSEYFPLEWMDRTINISQWYLVILACGHKDFPGHLLGRVCCTQSSGSRIEFLHSGFININLCWKFDLLPLSPATITRLRSSHISFKTLCIPRPRREEGTYDAARQAQSHQHETIKLVLPRKTRDALSTQGYTITLQGPDDVHPSTHRVTLAHRTHTITICYQHTLGEYYPTGQLLTFDTHVKTSGGAVLRNPSSPSPGAEAGGLRAPQVDCHARAAAVSWTSDILWENRHRVWDIELTTPKLMASRLSLGLAFATTNHYFLSIELRSIQRTYPRAATLLRRLYPPWMRRIGAPHRT